MVLLPALTNTQVLERTETIKYDEAQNMIEKTVKTTQASETVPLKGVTFGIGMGYSYLFKNRKDYFLTSDAAYKLKIQELNKFGIVLSSVISIKLGKYRYRNKMMT